MAKHSYQFTARSRVAMTEAILGMMNPRHYDGRTYPFCYNVKSYSAWPESAAELKPFHPEGQEFNAAWDKAWESYASASESLWWRIIEDMRTATESYSDYDGREGFEFSFAGRSGGWLVLESGPDSILWKGKDSDDIAELLAALPFAELKGVYRALVCIAHDSRREAVNASQSWAVAYARASWEAERQAELESCEAAIASGLARLRGLVAARQALPAEHVAPVQESIACAARRLRRFRIEAANLKGVSA